MLSHNDCNFNHCERILVVMLLNTIILESIKITLIFRGGLCENMSKGSKIDL